MYCPSCGVESAKGLKYCKHCGSNLNSPVSTDEPKRVVAMFWPIAAVSIVSVIGLLITVTELAGMNFDPRYLLGIVAFISAMIFGVVGLMIWLLLRLTGLSAPDEHKPLSESRSGKEPEQKWLPEPPISMPSVTEHTTRNFEPAEDQDSSARQRDIGQKVTR